MRRKPLLSHLPAAGEPFNITSNIRKPCEGNLCPLTSYRFRAHLFGPVRNAVGAFQPDFTPHASYGIDQKPNNHWLGNGIYIIKGFYEQINAIRTLVTPFLHSNLIPLYVSWPLRPQFNPT
jgi:hypothetical protein